MYAIKQNEYIACEDCDAATTQKQQQCTIHEEMINWDHVQY